MSTGKVGLSTALLVLLLVTSPTQAQRPPEIPIQDDLAGRSFRIRVVNGMNVPIYYKLVGGRGKSYVHQTLRPGASEAETVTGGEKVLCVWNASDEVIMTGVVRVARSGRIVIGGWAEAPSEAAPARAALPRIEITPD